MWTINELFYGPEPALTHIYEYSDLKPVEVGVVKEQNHAKEKKGNNGDVHLKVDMCCEACVRKVRRVLIELNGVNSINVNIPSKKVTVTGDVKAEACLKALAKIRKRASLWANAESGGGKEGKKNKNKDGK
ncbi:hypothetical protein M758_3G224700 [Ceratodon purpureus]|nr:hypothetical protein M758_3G224700 [Ceratodon purpureus]KAG0624105.1 hypothetical protein M758_3G224700 [Ceratodon purpureus]KAG0624106.1 hypothetical protein M758_3G224700 [Ceratodon purpureus]KAG0624107.1 hypothetical protein M758_3G224700 [Ceratodon purpureus]